MDNLEDKKEEHNTEDPNTQNPLNPRELIDAFKDLLKEVNLNELVDSFNNVKLEKIKSDEKKTLETLKSQDKTNGLNIDFWTKKFIKEFLVLLIILLVISYLAFNDKLDKNSIGTLLGSIIGYAIGNFNSTDKHK